MKKILYILTIAILLPFASSCEGMLEEKNYGNPTVDEMMSNPDNVGLLVGQIYADLKWVHDHWGYWGVSSLTSDEGACPVRYPGEDWLDGGYWKNLNSHNWNERGEAFENIWNTTISAAILCNKLIGMLEENKNVMDATTYGRYIGELETMRSYYYYLLFDCFGRIPYLEEFAEADNQPLSESYEVWSKLVMCLEKNAPNMAVVKSDADRKANYGRVTQGFAYALLARLYLNAESFGCTPENITISDEFYAANPSVTRIAGVNDFYTNAVRCCENVIGTGYGIESDFFANFKINNENSKENIFVIVENGLEGEDERSNGKMSNKLRIVALTMHYAHQTPWKLMEKPWNGFCARPKFMELYKGDATNGYDVRGAGPALPEGMPVPPYVMEKDDLEKEKGRKYSDDEYKAYRQGLLKEYHEALNTGDNCYAVKAKDFGTNSKQQWGWFIGPVFDGSGNKIVVDDKDFGAVITTSLNFNATKKDNNRCDGARMYKYEVDKAGAVKWAENDFVLMRYADVLWMKEEAIKRGGAGTSGMNTAEFQTMLKRSFAYSSNPEAAFQAAYGDVNSWTVDDILDERGREFAWELVRRRDLIRFNKYHDVEFVTAKDNYRNWFPIPYAVLQKSFRDENGNPIWTQNSGYVGTSGL